MKYKKIVVPVMVTSLAISSLYTGSLTNPVCSVVKAEEQLLTGNVNGMVIENGVLKRYEGNASEIIVPDGVVSIGEYAFEYKEGIQSITLAESVKKIESHAFYKCKELETVKILGTVETIDDVAFTCCEKLSSINLGKVKNIGRAAFSECKNLKEISLETINTLGDSAFAGTGVEKIELNFTGEDSYIGNYAFRECENLKEVIIKGQLTKIWDEVFLKCRMLENIQIEDTSHIAYIGSRAFDQTPWLSNQLKQSQSKMLIINDILVKYQPNVFYAGEYEGISYDELSVEEERTKMKDSAFTYAAPKQAQMETVTIPRNIKMIAGNAFYGAYSVENVIFDSSINKIEIGKNAFDFTTWEKEYLEKENFLIIGGNLVKANYNTEVIEVPNGVKTLVQGAFKVGCYTGKLPTEEIAKVKKIVLPQSVQEGATISLTLGNQEAGNNLETVIVPSKFKDAYAVPPLNMLFEDVTTSTEAKDILQGYQSEDSLDQEKVTPAPEVTENPDTSKEVEVTPTVGVETQKPIEEATQIPKITETPKQTEDVTATPKVTENPEPTKEVTLSPNVTTTPNPIATVTEAPKTETGATEIPVPTATIIPSSKTEIKVKKAVIIKVKRISGTKIKVSMKKSESVKGYQVLISTDKKFKKNVKKQFFKGQKVTIKKLKKGTKYYVKVRAYKLGDNKKKVYGKFSASKIIK